MTGRIREFLARVFSTRPSRTFDRTAPGPLDNRPGAKLGTIQGAPSGPRVLLPELPVPDSVGLSPEPAFGPAEPFYFRYFHTAPENSWSAETDRLATAYNREHAVELRRRIAVDTTQPNPYVVDRPFKGHAARDAAGKEVEATATAHPAAYKPRHAAPDDDAPTADLGDAIVGFLANWHRTSSLQQYAEARTDLLFGGA